MFLNIASYILLDLTMRVQAGPVLNYQNAGKLPVSVAHAELLGNVRSLSTQVNRDLGFQGRIDSHILLTYGDTLYSDGNYSDTWRGMTSDSMAYATRNPLEVLDVDLNDQGYPKQFCPLEGTYGEDAAHHAMGITNVIQTYPGQGTMNYLPHRALNSLILAWQGYYTF